MSRERKTPRPEEMLSDTPCRCGHTLEMHRASTTRECLHGADEMGRNPTCPCARFRTRIVRTIRRYY